MLEAGSVSRIDKPAVSTRKFLRRGAALIAISQKLTADTKQSFPGAVINSRAFCEKVWRIIEH
jgi:hypothetical protein